MYWRPPGSCPPAKGDFSPVLKSRSLDGSRFFVPAERINFKVSKPMSGYYTGVAH